MNDDGEENMASIDLAVTFFACVAMLFVFVSFVFAVEPPLRDRPSVGQSAATVEAVPSDWTAVVRRSTHAVLHAGTLAVISSEAAAGAIDGSAPVAAADQSSVSVIMRGRGIPEPAPPNAFVLAMSLDPGSLPQGWLRASVVPGPEAPCVPGKGSLLTVWIDAASGSLAPLLSWAERCEVELRYEHLRPTDTGRHSFGIGLVPAAFNLKTIFR